jgi:hypothetical protein
MSAATVTHFNYGWDNLLLCVSHYGSESAIEAIALYPRWLLAAT